MSLLQKLKSALGLAGTESSESGRSGDVDVTVEREPATEDEDAVKGTETASSGADSGDTAASPAESDESGSGDPAADEFETLAEEPAADDDDAEAATAGADEGDGDAAAAEPDADEPEADSAVDDTDAAAADESPADEPEADDEPADAAGSTDPVTELNGIGPAYGDRLADAGIETVGELAGADATDLADRIGLGESRVAGWIEQANDY